MANGRGLERDPLSLITVIAYRAIAIEIERKEEEEKDVAGN